MRRFAVIALLAGLVAVPASASLPRVTVAVHLTKVGSALSDSHGRALYVRVLDLHASTCYGSCALAWPPLLTAARPIAGRGAKQSLLGTTKRKDGKLQVTYAGHPLYYFGGDLKPGEITGQGTAATWWLVTPAGTKIATLPDGGYIGTTQDNGY